jgi:hypothetical protein
LPPSMRSATTNSSATAAIAWDRLASLGGSHPFDAVATKGGQRRFLEAKGRQTDGHSVLVTVGQGLRAQPSRSVHHRDRVGNSIHR